MAIDIKAISCPQCGSTDIQMTSETQGICKSCGTQFSVQQRIETQNVYNEIYIQSESEADEEDVVDKVEIIPEFSKEDFIRAAWIALAEEDVPFDVFEQNFGEVSQTEHQVLIRSIDADMTYQASIGYDRQEPYIAYESYYETESYYDSQGHKQTRQVRKERPVTKYKTVTDWNALHGNHSASAIAVVENTSSMYLDEVLFKKSFRSISAESLTSPSDEKATEMQITETALKAANSDCVDQFHRSVCNSLPGNHYKDVNCNISAITKLSDTLYLAQEYETTLNYNGKTYTKNAFAFGNINIGGDKIENDESLKKITDKISKKKECIPGMIWDKTKTISLITMALLTLSIIVAIFIHVTALVVIAFIIAAGSFVYNTISVNKETKSITATITTEVNAEIEDYISNYKVKQREILNNKLKSLGYKPVSADEL